MLRRCAKCAALLSLLFVAACGRPTADSRFDPQQRAGLHAIEMDKPARISSKGGSG